MLDAYALRTAFSLRLREITNKNTAKQPQNRLYLLGGLLVGGGVKYLQHGPGRVLTKGMYLVIIKAKQGFY
ncbi:hypothetical protein D6C13_23605 [Rahnella woolbedingensis]|uniref:Uncharacterized protein n=1 Tax=Rahnella woolbedingensis TaxID=1510574 RepID=A0A419N2E0_9GAMM|nr:hypothetical protein D6C13_23605 [Rahnella woolbedingensis]